MDKKRFLIILISILSLVLGIVLIIVAIAFAETFKDTKDILINIGAGLVPGSLISLVIEYAINKELRKQIDITIGEKLKDEISKLKNFDRHGLDDILPQFMADGGMLESIKKSKNEIRIINAWIPNFTNLKTSLVEAVLKNDCQIKILLLDEKSKILRYRTSQLRLDDITVRERIRTSNKDVQNLITTLKDKGSLVEVKTFDDLLPFSMYQFDDLSYIGWYLEGYQSIETPFLKLVKSGEHTLLFHINEHFEYLWGKGEIKTFTNNK